MLRVQAAPPIFWFLVVITGIMLLLGLYTSLRWAVPLRKSWMRWSALSLIVVLFAIQFFAPLVYRSSPQVRGFWLTTFQWAAYISLGFIALVLIYSLLWDIGYGLARLFSPGSFEPARRKFLWGASRASILALSAGQLAAGVWEARRGPRLKRVIVPVQGLHRDLDGLRIAQISDLHVGPTIERKYVERVARMVQETSPDLIALTGDLVDGTVEQLGADIEPLSALRGKLGTFCCSGNHEYFAGGLPWLREYERLGMQVLGNAHVVLKRGGAKLLVGGVYDHTGPRFVPEHTCDPVAAAHGAPEVDYRILLQHQPKDCELVEKAGWQLMLSGHTHGGQFFPWSLFVRLAFKYVRGLYRHSEQLWVYVNSGTAYWGPPIRFGLPSEITLLELKSV